MESQPYPHRDQGADPKLPPLMVFFREEAVKNELASRAGPAIYDRVVFIRVVAPGQKQGFPIYEICRTYEDGREKLDHGVYARFGEVYEQWKKRQAPSMSGTPLEQWPLMDVALVAVFKDANVYTVQQLAALGDNGLDNIRGKGREWRAKAIDWLDQAKSAAGDAEARATIARQQEQIEQLQAQMKEMLAKQNNVGFDKKRKNGRAEPGELVSIPDDADLEFSERL